MFPHNPTTTTTLPAGTIPAFVSGDATAWLGRGLSAYSNYSKEIPAHPWDSESADLLSRIEETTKASFNSALVNHYRNGHDYMGFHSDDEPSLGAKPIIASVSLGAERDFVFKDRASNKTVCTLLLGHGSLLIMRGKSQEKFKHGLPKRLRVLSGRINLTFRKIESEYLS